MILHPIPGSLVPDVELDGTQAQRRSRAPAGGGPDGLPCPGRWPGGLLCPGANNDFPGV